MWYSNKEPKITVLTVFLLFKGHPEEQNLFSKNKKITAFAPNGPVSLDLSASDLKKEYCVSSGRAMKLFMPSTDHYELVVQGLLQSPVSFK